MLLISTIRLALYTLKVVAKFIKKLEVLEVLKLFNIIYFTNKQPTLISSLVNPTKTPI
jgi:hypothetical protein